MYVGGCMHLNVFLFLLVATIVFADRECGEETICKQLDFEALLQVKVKLMNEVGEEHVSKEADNLAAVTNNHAVNFQHPRNSIEMGNATNLLGKADEFVRMHGVRAQGTTPSTPSNRFNSRDEVVEEKNDTSHYRPIVLALLIFCIGTWLALCLVPSRIANMGCQASYGTRRKTASLTRMAEEQVGNAPLSSEEESRSGYAGSLPVILLVLLFTMSQWARQSIYYVVDFKALPSHDNIQRFMNLNMGFDETQYSILASIGFATAFSVFSLKAGGIVDKVNSRDLLASSAMVWTVATIWQGTASNFNEVLGSRILSGIGQAFGNPTSYATLALLYPESCRASVNGLYSSGIYFGAGLAALSVVINESLGWRQLLMFIGGLGFLTTLCVQLLLPSAPPLGEFLVPSTHDETTAGKTRSAGLNDKQCNENIEQADTRTDTSLGASLCALVSEPAISLLLTATAFRFLAGFTVGVWIMPFYRERFPGSIGTEFALTKAAISGLAGSVSATGGGILADRIAKRHYRMWIPALGSAIAVPCWLGALKASSLNVSLFALFLEYIFAECWLGPTLAELQSLAPQHAHGLITGLFSCLTLVGNLAPFLMGLALQSGNYQLLELLSYSVSALYALSAIVFLVAGEAIRDLSPRNS